MTPDKQMVIVCTHPENVSTEAQILNIEQLQRALWNLLMMILLCNKYGEGYA